MDMHADAIVNTANAYPVIGSGVDETIYEAAGKEALIADRMAVGEIPPGQAAITPAHNLNAKYIIHAVSPKWRGGRNFEKMLLKSSYEHIMRLAVENNCSSVAMPLLATGNNRFPRGMSLDLAVEVATKYIDKLDDFTVYIVVYDDASFGWYTEQDFIDWLNMEGKIPFNRAQVNYFGKMLERVSNGDYVFVGLETDTSEKSRKLSIYDNCKSVGIFKQKGQKSKETIDLNNIKEIIETYEPIVKYTMDDFERDFNKRNKKTFFEKFKSLLKRA